jgi:hypothetical protein
VKKVFPCLITLVVLLLIVSSASGVTINVFDPTNSPITGFSWTLTDNTIDIYETWTDTGRGFLLFDGLEAGLDYSLRIHIINSQNKPSSDWHIFSTELLDPVGQDEDLLYDPIPYPNWVPIGYSTSNDMDGLNFAQGSGIPRTSTSFSNILVDEISDARDFIEFSNGLVSGYGGYEEQGFGLRDNGGNNQPFLLAQSPNEHSLPSLFDIVQTTDTADVFYIKQADVDSDNYTDVIYTGNTADSLYIAYGKADGTLETPQNYLKVSKAALAIDFVNGDMLPDIIAHTTEKVYVLLNLGNRNFAVDSQTVSLSSWGSNGERSSIFPSIATGYFNDDAYLDAVVSQSKILFGNGTGSFPTSTTLIFPFDAVSVSDFDRNGTDDLVVTAGDSAFVYLNDGSGNMSRSTALRVGYLTHDFTSVVAGMDLNADGKTDFVTVTGNTIGTNDTSVVTVALGDGSGGVTSSDTLRTVGTALNLALADIDKDHDLDISLVNATTRSLVVTLNDGLGGFASPVSISLGSGANPLYTLINADVDRNGAPDFVIGGQAGNPILLAVSEIPDDPILPQEMVTTAYNYVTLRVENPLGLVISRPLSTIAGSAYWRMDTDDNHVIDESAYDYNLQYGEYRVVIGSRANVPENPVFSVGIRIDGTEQNTIFQQYTVPAGGDSIVFYYQVESVSSIYPSNGHPTANPQPTFKWNGLVGKSRTADSYEFQLDRYYDFRSPILSVTGLTSPQYHIPIPLGGDSVFYWRIRPVTGGIPGDYTRTFAAYLLDYLCGDCNGDGTVDISDVVCQIYYIFSGGPAPEPLLAGDANCDSTVDISDTVYLIAYIFSGGQAPCAQCEYK